MVGSRFTAPVSATANSIAVYIYNSYTSNNLKAAIYRDSDQALIATTETLYVANGFNGWQTFNLATKPSLTSGTTYSLVVWFSNSGSTIYYTSGTTRQSWYASKSDGNLGNSYSYYNYYGQENNVYSIYCNFGSTSTSTPQPTPTPSPTYPTTANNLATMPTKWWVDREGQKIDNTVTYNGKSSIRLDPTSSWGNNPARECVGPWIAIKPGDHVVYTCWIKITASGKGDTSLFSGARLGIDFYDSTNRITGLMSSTWEGVTYNGIANWPSSAAGEAANYVHWGTQGWVQRRIDFIVPWSMPGDGGSIGGSSHGYGTYVPCGMLPTIQVWGTYGSTDPGQAWFADAQIYVNP